jgi:hypothetical protein
MGNLEEADLNLVLDPYVSMTPLLEPELSRLVNDAREQIVGQFPWWWMMYAG